MHFIDKPVGKFVDRRSNSEDSAVDVLMLTLDAELSLERTLFSIFKEIPVHKIFVCDGGSKDKTVEILKKFPRIEILERPDIRTTGKALEFLFSKVETDWFVVIDSDIILEEEWFAKMMEKSNLYDVMENGKRISAYHFYRDQKSKMNDMTRSLDLCHLIKKETVKNYQCDDDFMWRYTDIFLRQTVEKEGFRYGKVNDTYHVHNEIERVAYGSDSEKNYQEIKFVEPKLIIHDQKKLEHAMIKHAKAVVKYLDPDYPMVKNDKNYETILRLLDRDWISENGPKWLKRYDSMDSKSKSVKGLAKKIFSNLKDKR